MVKIISVESRSDGLGIKEKIITVISPLQVTGPQVGMCYCVQRRVVPIRLQSQIPSVGRWS